MYIYLYLFSEEKQRNIAKKMSETAKEDSK